LYSRVAVDVYEPYCRVLVPFGIHKLFGLFPLVSVTSVCGCAPIRIVIKSGSLAIFTHGAPSDAKPRLILDRANSPFTTSGISLPDGGSALLNALPNALAASIVFFDASELTHSIIPSHDKGLVSQKLSPPCNTDHRAPSLSKMSAILAHVLIASLSLFAESSVPQTNNSIFCPAKGASCLTSFGVASSSNRHLGPRAVMSFSSWSNCLDARWVHFRARRRAEVLPSYRLALEFLGVGLVALTGHLGGFLSGVNGPG
jgi:hypothetical protein